MWRKRIMSAIAAGMALTILMAFPAMAHGHGRYRQTSVSASISETDSLVCPLEGCGQAGYHTHDGSGYWGCYPVCTAEGCSTTGYHTHDSQECWGCYPVCTVEGCTESGHHVHDGHGYCGYEHSSGYCDGSCMTAGNNVSHHRQHCGRR